MPAGYVSNGYCVPTLLEAAQLACAEFPRVVSTTTTLVTYSCQTTGTAGGFIIRPWSGGTAGTATTITPAYATCDTDSFNAPRQIGGDIVPALNTLFAATFAALAVIWGVKRVYQILWPYRDET